MYRTDTHIVGMYYNKGASEELALLSRNAKLVLVREPKNPFDKNAVAVHTRSGVKLGHVPRNHAALVAHHLDLGAKMSVTLTSPAMATVTIEWGA